MKLAYSTNAYTEHTLEAALESIADLGFAGVEILCDTPHWFPGKIDKAEIDRVRSILKNRSLRVSNLNANTANGYYDPLPPENVFEPALSNPDPELRQWRIDYSIETLRLAAELDANAISVTSGRPGGAGILPEVTLDCFVDSLKQICEHAAALGVRVGIEYEPGLLIETADEVLDVIRRVDSPWLGVNFDIGHSYVAGEDPVATVEKLAGRIWNVHAEDIKGRKHYHLIPGEGNLPFGVYFDALRKSAYDGFITLELYTYTHAPAEAGKRARDYLQPLLNRA